MWYVGLLKEASVKTHGSTLYHSCFTKRQNNVRHEWADRSVEREKPKGAKQRKRGNVQLHSALGNTN